MHDAMVYIQDAQAIATGGLGNAGMGKEPGYSMLIAPLFFLFSSPIAIMFSRFLNIILVSGASFIFYLTARVLLPKASVKRIFIFSLLFALSPQLSSFSSLRLYPEPLQLFLNSLILFCLVKIFMNKESSQHSVEWKAWLIAGLGMGMLMITKSLFLIYPFWFVFFILMHRIFFTKVHAPVKTIAKPIIIFLCISFLLPLLWSARNYKKFGYFMVAGRGSLVLLSHTYLVDWGFKDSLKWGVFQISDSLGKLSFPKDADRMAKVTGEPYIEAQRYLNTHANVALANNDVSAMGEWRRLIQEHPFRYVWFYFLNALNHVLFEGVYPDIFPVNKTAVIKYIYLVSAVLLHLLYSIFIWVIIAAGVFKYWLKSGDKFLQGLEFKYTIIACSLTYFAFFAYHFHTEIRYFHPFYFNVYLLFALSYNYLFKDKYEVSAKGN